MKQTAQRIIEFWVQKFGDAFEEDQNKGAILVERMKHVQNKQTFVFFPDQVHSFCGDHKQILKEGSCFCSCKDFEFKKKPCKHLLGSSIKIIDHLSK